MDAINLKVDSPLAQPAAPRPTVPRYDDNPAPQSNGAGNSAAAAGNGQTIHEPQPPPSPPPPPPEQEQAFQEAMDQAPPERPPEPWVTNENGKIKLRLRKGVPAHGETVNYLFFKEPTGGDIERIGNPVSMGGGSVNFDAPVMTSMMSHLAGVPTSTIRLMHAVDWNNGAYAIWNFFVPDAFR